MAPKLEHCLTLRGYLSKENTIDCKIIKGGPQRLSVPVSSGFIKGTGQAEGLEAELLPGGADWLLIDLSNNVAHLDVRANARTTSGDSIYAHYTGILKLDDSSTRVIQGSADAKSTEYGDHEFFVGPIFETSSEKYKWIETCLWIGQGHFVVDKIGSAVEYHIYRVIN